MRWYLPRSRTRAFTPVLGQAWESRPPPLQPTPAGPLLNVLVEWGEVEANKLPRGAAGAKSCWHIIIMTHDHGAAQLGVPELSQQRGVSLGRLKTSAPERAEAVKRKRPWVPLPPPRTPVPKSPSLHPTRFHRRRNASSKGGPE